MKARPANLLIVDDTVESLDLLVYFLKPAGYAIQTATTGRAALEHISRELPDLILLDVMLPDINGYEICERLKKDTRTRHIPIIMITALKELKDKIQGLEAGADDFVTKPFDSVELLARVRSLLRLKTYHDGLIRQNAELQRQKKLLEREEKFKKDLTDLIVHDMKGPLFVIQGNLQMWNMTRDAQKDVDDRKYTDRIERSSRNLLHMILNLLDISRLEQDGPDLSPVPVDLHRLLKEQIAYFRELPQHQDKEIVYHWAEKLPHAYVDKGLFERALINILNPAFQNCSDDGTVTIMTRRENGGTIQLRICHPGRPIPEKYHEKTFQKYAQTELKQAGFKLTRGLGLVAARLLLEACGGSLRLDPSVTDGIGYCITLPIWDDHSASGPQTT